MPFPFEPFSIGPLTVSNGLVMAPLHEITDHGAPSAIARRSRSGSGRTPFDVASDPGVVGGAAPEHARAGGMH